MSMTMAARAYDDAPMTAPAPSRTRRRASAKPAIAAAPLAWFRRKLRNRPLATLAYCAFGVAAAAIAVNALVFQKSMIPRAFIGEPASQRAAAPPAPQPPARPAELAAAQTPPRQSAAPAPAAVPAPAQPAQTVQRERAPAPAAAPQREAPVRDPLGDLIRTGQVNPIAPVEPMRPPAPIVERASAQAETRPVLAAQRALNRLGFGPVKTDGRFGEETRAAIERFERDRRIPVTRDLSPRTLRELASASGARLE